MKTIMHLKTSSNVGGAETMLCFWPELLDKSKFKQVFIMGENGPLVGKINESGCETIVLNKFGSFFGLFYIPWLLFFVKKRKIDLMHAHGARVNLWGSVVSLFTKVPIISTEHNIDIWREGAVLYNFIDRLIGRINSKRVGVSQAVCEMLNVKGMNKSKIICINNGINVRVFDDNFENINFVEPSNSNEDRVVIGTIGRLVQQKGHKYLIHAFSKLAELYDQCILVIVGEGPLENELRALASSYGLDGKIVFTGVRTDIPACLASFDIFVLPSITEGLPLVLLEAMASKKAVVASAVSGVPYVIDDGVDGVLVPPKDIEKIVFELERLIVNASLRESLGVKALHKVTNHFNAKRMIADYENLYLETIENIHEI